MTQQPKEYIITEGQLDFVENAHYATEMALVQFANEIRSRPHTQAPADPCEENGCTDTDQCDEICEHQRIYTPAQMKAAKAEAARTATMAAYTEMANAILILGTTEDCPYGKCRRENDKVHDPWGCVKCISESLRQQAGEQE
jgi:hypothetical protein